MEAKVTAAQIQAALREHMRQLGRVGGKRGGTARAKNMSAADRSKSARKAARARWAKAKKKA